MKCFTGDQRGVGLDLGELARGLAQAPDRARRRGRGGVVAGGGDDHVVAHRLEVVDRLAVQLAVGDNAGQVLARTGLAVIGDRLEVHKEVRDDALQCGHGFRALQVLLAA
jgi:hypothetical protein